MRLRRVAFASATATESFSRFPPLPPPRASSLHVSAWNGAFPRRGKKRRTPRRHRGEQNIEAVEGPAGTFVSRESKKSRENSLERTLSARDFVAQGSPVLDGPCPKLLSPVTFDDERLNPFFFTLMFLELSCLVYLTRILHVFIVTSAVI